MNVSNETGNATTGQSDYVSWSSLKQLSSEKVTVVIKCAALVLVGIVGSFGNTLTLVAIRKTPSLWTKSNTLLAALTAANLYMSVIQFPFFAVFNLWVYVFADNSCDYKKAIGGMFPVTKTFNHVIYCLFIAIAADRYVAIIYPFHYETKMTMTVIKCLIGGSCAFGLTVAAIYYSYLQYVDWSTCDVPYSTVMTAVIDIGVHFTVMLVTILVYGRILLVALKHRSKISSMTVTSSQVNAIPDPKTMKEFKAARMTAVLVCAYTLPLLTYDIGRIMQACGNLQHYTVKLVDVGSVFGNLNIGFDWVIYGIMNGMFRRAYMKVLKIKTADRSSD